MMAIPNSETKPTAAETLKFVPVRYKAQIPPTATSKTLREDDDRVQHRVERRVEQDEDHAE